MCRKTHRVHFHSLDGVYVCDGEGGLRFHELGKANAEEIVEVARWTSLESWLATVARSRGMMRAWTSSRSKSPRSRRVTARR